MIKDTVVLDIETKNSFADVGGRDNLHRLEVSLVCLYSYVHGKNFSFRETQLKELEEFLRDVGCIVGFAINRFDVPVLNKYFNFDLMAIPRIDLLEEIEMSVGWRIGLDRLAQFNLGIGKTSHGLEAIKFYREGNWDKLEAYCLNDVKITKDLYELAKQNGCLVVPHRETGKAIKAIFDLSESIIPQTLF
ncbi:MAG: ribonuclease H-like domain-containing protein [bacterium]|nr:ribonuclease H-like domain-containing protein [bacterium]